MELTMHVESMMLPLLLITTKSTSSKPIATPMCTSSHLPLDSGHFIPDHLLKIIHFNRKRVLVILEELRSCFLKEFISKWIPPQ